MQNSRATPLFKGMAIEVTPDVRALIEANGMTVEGLVEAHSFGNWGRVLVPLWNANDVAFERGCAVFSVFEMLFSDDRIMVLTLPDRLRTLVWRVSDFRE